MMLIGVIALLMSAILAYWIYVILTGNKIPTQAIVIASKNIHPGEILTAENLTTVSWPRYHPVPGSFENIKQVENRAVMVEIFPNDIVLKDKLVAQEGMGGLTAVIDREKRAISVKVDSVIGVAGFVLPGTYVDVIATGQPANSDDLVSKVIVENVKVLTADKNLERDPKGEAKESKVVTLLVNPDQANKIALASTDGHLQLALRNSQDTNIETPPPITKKQLYAQDQATTIIKGKGKGFTVKPPPPRPPQPIEVEERMGTTQKLHKVDVEAEAVVEQPQFTH
jgi:pilus assembly protein CpaB